ncbi:hypothetical protein Tsubulata_034679 [Turnera subulata]|uniref:Potassium channel domain-containing protein n=1 Tax=Turnera subulata TaxID=218843 RepID=A0A9Q0GJ94_9ROSI|nr:hypothetical protein Tsubulata_034679 [Turnera subulata]
MAYEPLLANAARPPEGDPFILTQSFSTPILFPEIRDDPPPPQQQQVQPSSSSPPRAPTNTHFKKPGSLRRCKTAPAMVAMREPSPAPAPEPEPESGSFVRVTMLLLCVYLLGGGYVYFVYRESFSGDETYWIVDALYFCVVTMCTIGYGDITPMTPETKLFVIVFVLMGFGIIGTLLNGLVTYVLDLQESMILSGVRNTGHENNHHHGVLSAWKYIFDPRKGRVRVRSKVSFAVLIVVLSLAIGTSFLYFIEQLDFVDSVYLAVMSVTTVGYGDRAFKTLTGRIFAILWLLVSTLAVARAFLFLTEMRIEKRQKRALTKVLKRNITVEDLLAADMNHNGYIRCGSTLISEYPELFCLTIS